MLVLLDDEIDLPAKLGFKLSGNYVIEAPFDLVRVLPNSIRTHISTRHRQEDPERVRGDASLTCGHL